MSSVKLRPHHLLCLHFFEGKGYSDEFTANMTSVKLSLEQLDPRIELVRSADIICGSCPNNINGVCSSEEKVKRYDGTVLSICGIDTDCGLSFSRLQSIVLEKIVYPHRLQDVCGDCQWSFICAKKADESVEC